MRQSPVRIGINGFGRIGRAVLRLALHRDDLEFVAINDLSDAPTLAYLLKYDSVHGVFQKDVSGSGSLLKVGKKTIQILNYEKLEQLPWGKLGVDVVLECTGHWTHRKTAQLHRQQGAKKIIISAPADDPDMTFIMGINEKNYKPEKHHVVSNASCTTNCLALVTQVLIENFGIRGALMSTVHSYTNDQKLLDLPHKDPRRGRAAAINIVPTTTGATKALIQVFPALKAKFDGLSIRVPVANVSLVDLVVHLAKQTTRDEMNKTFEKASRTQYKNYLSYTEEPLVSQDFNGSPYSAIVDGLSTQIINGDLVKIVAWYDNEMGFSQRMVDLVTWLAKKGV